VIFLFHPLLGVLAVIGALVMVGLAWLNERLTREPLERAQTEARRAARFIDSNVRNAEVVNALGMLPAVTARWARLNDAALGEQARAAQRGSLFSGLTKFSRQVIQLAMLAGGAYLVVEQHVTGGVMIAATILLSRALAPVESLVAGWRNLVEARSAWKRLDQLLKDTPANDPGTELPAPAGRLEVDRVVFGFGDKAILRGVSFKLEPGEALGIIGPSASGKSTLVRLVVGVWKARAGTVRLDGADVATWPRERLGPHIGYLPQDVELFGGTVAENIARLGVPDDAEVIRAAQRARVHELILRLPKGYETEIGDAGQALSPGQRQRIGLARALYSPLRGSPRLVVLDEPNADLDSEGEEALLGALQALKADGVTLIIVAHRPSLLRGVDKMLVLREGAVERFGARNEVMERVTRQVA
jgi:PrtD family type I secretion system ABC transporter